MAISGGVVTLTLDSAAVATDTVKVRYTQPSSNPLQDAAGNPVATFTDQAVINTTGSLVSNAGQTFIPRNIAVDYAQAFTTGSHADGYTLTRVDVFMRAGGVQSGVRRGHPRGRGGSSRRQRGGRAGATEHSTQRQGRSVTRGVGRRHPTGRQHDLLAGV